MTIMTCIRCGKQTAKVMNCSYCNKQLCYACIKSSKRIKKIKRYNICKDCWGKMPVRRKFKSS